MTTQTAMPSQSKPPKSKPMVNVLSQILARARCVSSGMDDRTREGYSTPTEGRACRRWSRGGQRRWWALRILASSISDAGECRRRATCAMAHHSRARLMMADGCLSRVAAHARARRAASIVAACGLVVALASRHRDVWPVSWSSAKESERFAPLVFHRLDHHRRRPSQSDHQYKTRRADAGRARI